MLKDWLLELLGARPSPGARSDAHGHLAGRIGLHLFLVALAAFAALVTSRLVSETELPQVSAIPPAPLSGVRAIASTGEELLRPGVSHDTEKSVLRTAHLPSRVPQLRPTDTVNAGGTLSGGLVRAAADTRDAGYEVRPLSEQIDPTVPYVVYEVRSGDTLGEIAETYGTTVDNILLNNAEVGEGGWIAPGQQVLVPFGTGILYRVGQGETLAGIIDDYDHVTVADVLAYEPNKLSDADDIQPARTSSSPTPSSSHRRSSARMAGSSRPRLHPLRGNSVCPWLSGTSSATPSAPTAAPAESTRESTWRWDRSLPHPSTPPAMAGSPAWSGSPTATATT